VTTVRGEATLRVLHQVRGEGRLSAEDTMRHARLRVAERERELELCRDRLAKLIPIRNQSEFKVKAAVLQRRQACESALAVATRDARLAVQHAAAAVTQARSTLATADQQWRDACGQERVVERVMTRRDLEAKRNEQRAEDDDNDDRSLRR
jgi:flagellar biosynthesis chaperone FliJ